MIWLNDVPSFRDPEHYKITPDDRVQKIEIIGGIAIQDLGHVAEGDTFSVTCMFSPDDFTRFYQLWETRTKVTFRDTAGKAYANMRIVLKEYGRDKDFPEYISASFELWRK